MWELGQQIFGEQTENFVRVRLGDESYDLEGKGCRGESEFDFKQNFNSDLKIPTEDHGQEKQKS